MKKVFLALVAFVGVGGGAFALAASLDVISTTLGSGDDDVVSCDTEVNTSYTVVYGTSPLGYRVDTVIVSNIASPACDNGTVSVTLTGAGNADIGKGAKGAGTSGTVTFSGADLDAHPLASLLTDIHVAIQK